MLRLIIEVSDTDGDSILEWVSSKNALGENHRVFITSSVPALHMWNVEWIGEVWEDGD